MMIITQLQHKPPKTANMMKLLPDQYFIEDGHEYRIGLPLDALVLAMVMQKSNMVNLNWSP